MDYKDYGLNSTIILSVLRSDIESEYITVEQANKDYNDTGLARVCKAGKVIIVGKEG